MGRNNTETIEIPDKVYFKIGEVCRLTGVKPHTLRYWESEFTTIKPQRVGSKQRMYRRVDVENILLLKKMLHEDGMTLAGARKSLARKPKDDIKGTLPVSVFTMVHEVKRQLLAIRDLIS
ncbi:MAG: MerR family transcriptional regulator [Proteobacteria bacterium]|nr:MerR family transcriptional regulator [Desulfobulbaceae bacterium]MBU4152231.1 MerR family transcriptional regulator [Pseudomonadota bacterium]MDP2106447.1 MerR family transcriptional regulator [Desulfobulbaceae bacterium]